MSPETTVPPRTVPEFLISPETDEIFEMMIMQSCPIAHLFRAAGEPIPPKTEKEQAFVLRWLLQLAHEHGRGWRAAAGAEIEQRQAIARAAPIQAQPREIR